MTTIIPQTEQSGTIASQLVWLPFGARTVSLAAIMNAADIATAGNVVGVALIWSFDGTRTALAAHCVWQSGVPGGAPNAVPGLSVAIPPNAIGFAGQIVAPQALNIGLAMDIRDAHDNSLPIVAPSGSGVPVQVPVYPMLHA